MDGGSDGVTIVQVKAVSELVTSLGIHPRVLLPHGLLETIVRETATLPDTHGMSHACSKHACLPAASMIAWSH
jgi:hypothetical protein